MLVLFRIDKIIHVLFELLQTVILLIQPQICFLNVKQLSFFTLDSRAITTTRKVLKVSIAFGAYFVARVKILTSGR